MQECNPNQVFVNHSKEEEIFSLTTQEIVEVQKANNKLKHCFKHTVEHSTRQSTGSQTPWQYIRGVQGW